MVSSWQIEIVKMNNNFDQEQNNRHDKKHNETTKEYKPYPKLFL